MKKAIEAMTNWWLAPMPAERLAAVRIASTAYALWYLITRIDMLDRLARSDADLFAPVGLAVFFAGPIPADLFQYLVFATIGIGVFALLGAGFRISGPLFALLLFFVLSYRNSWSMIFHSHNSLVFHALILAFTGAADKWSLDATLRKRSGRRGPEASWRYGWPIMLIGFATIAPYFLSAIAKVLGPEGWAWAGGESMRSQVIVNAIRYEVLEGKTQPLLNEIVSQTWIFAFFGVLALVVEFAAPLALANRRLGFIWACTAFAMHWGIYFVMGIGFRYQMSGLTYVSFLNAEGLVKVRPRATKSPATGHCDPDPSPG